MLHPYYYPVMSVTSTALLSDEHGRVARYLRLSVTDHCNFRCSYCRGGVEDNFIPHTSILRYEELLTIVAASLRMGIQKIRLTGGEPFVRKGFMNFVATIHDLYPEVDLRITTNGTLVRPHVPKLQELGIKAINISLDSFNKATFARITGRDMLEEVLLTIEALLAAGIGVKINAVAMRGVSDVEMKDFISFAMQHRVDVRFIEFMPMGAETTWTENLYLPAQDILQEAKKFVDLEPLQREAQELAEQGAEQGKEEHQNKHQGPARMYRLYDGQKEGQGRLGIISALSNHFCHWCNRLRVTSDGQLRTCLFADTEHDLRHILRSESLCAHEDAAQRQHCLEQELCQVFEKAIKEKPLGEALLKAKQAQAVAQKKMVSIGG